MTKRSTLSALLILALGSVAACAGEPVYGPGSGTGTGSGNGTGGGADDPDDDGGQDGEDGEDGDDGDPGTGGGAEAVDVMAAISDAECDAAFACRSSYQGNFSQDWGANVNACYQDGYELYELDALVAAIEAGTVQVDGAAASDCAAAVQSVAQPNCSSFFQQGLDLPQSCGAMFSGTVADGGQCQSSWECESGGYCDNGTCGQ